MEKEASVFCPDCGRPHDAVDNFCRFCGHPLRSRLSLVLSPRLLPQIWRETRSSLWRGLAALALGTALEVLRREAVRRLSAPSPSRRRGKGQDGSPPEGGGDGHGYGAQELLGYRRFLGRF